MIDSRQAAQSNGASAAGIEARATVNLARVDLLSLRIAVACAELGSLTAAARSMSCSPSTASFRLKALEQSFGTEFFIRVGHGLRVTRSGQQLVNHGRALLEHLDLIATLIRATRDPSTQQS
ncbi:LysR family transcriptional regulator [Variovorax paradoxus]|nr:LysR family transcriptional regulator [Variovorax paradoxus]